MRMEASSDHNGIVCGVIRESGEFLDLSDSWRELLRDVEVVEPVHTPSWLITWWEVFGKTGGRDLRVLAFRNAQGELIGLLPLLARTVVSYRRPIPLRRLELLASGEAEEHEICSEYIGAIVRRGWHGPVARATAELLRGGGIGAWDELLMTNMRADDPFVPSLQHAMAECGMQGEAFHQNVSFYAELPGTWQAYLQGLKATHRYAVRRAMKDFEAWRGSREVVLRCATGGSDRREALGVLRQLHERRWSGRGGVFRSQLFSEFHERLGDRLEQSRDAQVEVLSLVVGGEPISALYNFVVDGRIRYYQAGRRTGLPQTVRPGIVLHALALQRAIEHGQREYDFLATKQQYKAQLATHRRALVGFRAVAPTATARRRVETLRWLDRAESRVRSLGKLARNAVEHRKATATQGRIESLSETSNPPQRAPGRPS
jgi:CelD/BcsL family acetyltransferase involved in cellulose biosynthesis